MCYLGTQHGAVGDKAAFNEELFSLLLAQEDEIEAVVGEDLIWEALEGKQACWIGLAQQRPDLNDPAQRDEAIAWAADAVIRLVTALEKPARSGACELLALRRHAASSDGEGGR